MKGGAQSMPLVLGAGAEARAAAKGRAEALLSNTRRGLGRTCRCR